MRCDQPMGLCLEALAFLNSFQKTCLLCGAVLPLKSEKIGHYTGMYGNEYPLCRYQLTDSILAHEFLQFEVWDSGPVLYLGLKVSDGQVFRWNEKEIDIDNINPCLDDDLN